MKYALKKEITSIQNDHKLFVIKMSKRNATTF